VGGTKDVNIDKIRKLAPTHVIVNIDENEKPTFEALAAFVPHMVVTHPLAPRDNLALARLMGGIFGASEAAERWCAAFELRIRRSRRKRAGPPRTVLYCIWQDPWMSVSSDTYIARMLGELGWQVPALPDTSRYPRFAWSDQLVGPGSTRCCCRPNPTGSPRRTRTHSKSSSAFRCSWSMGK
jgi:ABC-type Fe3+-hydroxamate transport system substrate-binding protein